MPVPWGIQWFIQKFFSGGADEFFGGAHAAEIFFSLDEPKISGGAKPIFREGDAPPAPPSG